MHLRRTMSLVTSPIYDITKSLQENIQHGPFWSEPFPKKHLHSKRPSHTFLGLPLCFPFGVAACPLTINSKFTTLISSLGFDLITYKSVRSVKWKGNEFPNWLYADMPKSLKNAVIPSPVTAHSKPFPHQDISMVNSFGISSPSPKNWQEDVDKACDTLDTDQILILSLMLTPQNGEKLSVDASRLGELASKTKAKIFELDLSCPNSDEGSGSLYENVELSTRLCKIVGSKLQGRPLLAKVGYYKDSTVLRNFMAQSKGIIAGISTMNTLSIPVVLNNQQEAFPGRPTAGLSGSAIRQLAYEQLLALLTFKQELHLLDFVTICMGGVTRPGDIENYLKAGADAVQSVVGAWDNPYLAHEWKTQFR